MFTMLTVIRKRPEVSTEEFRRFMELEYGTTYAQLPETREYVQYYLSDAAQDDAEDPIDAVVRISFDSRREMQKALEAEAYVTARERRRAFMRDTSVGIHPALVERVVRIV